MILFVILYPKLGIFMQEFENYTFESWSLPESCSIACLDSLWAIVKNIICRL